MLIKKIGAKKVKDSRGEDTIQIIVQTNKGKFKTSAPSGKSKGKYEVKSYAQSLEKDIQFINALDLNKINSLDLKKFSDLKRIEKLVLKKIGGNSLFALEASLLKAIAKENKKELWEFLGGKRNHKIRAVGNSVGGGLHSRGVNGKKPDFQEFLFIADCNKFSDCVRTNKKAYNLTKKFLRAKKRNDEGAWETNKTNEEVFEILNRVRYILKKKFNFKIDIGVDIAASSFFKKGHYFYKNPRKKLTKNEQINYINNLIKKYNIFYIEDGLDETDFSGFRNLKGKLIVGDDLIVTNPQRLKKAIRMKSVSGIIVKPNQIGSLLKVKEVIDLAKKYKIKTIISHRSGETKDNTIADLGIGFDCDFIKTGIYGKVRTAKLKRLMNILG